MVSGGEQFRRSFSVAMYFACAACALLMVVVLALVTYYLAVKGLGSVSLSLFTNTGRDEPEGLYHGIEGTLVLLGLASLVGVPMGLLTGVYLSEYQGESWLSYPVRFTCDVLAGVPSIVVGVVGYELLVVPMGRSSAWAGAAALAFIMVPIIARTTEEMLRLVPQSFREGSLALGATKAQTVLKVVLPAASGSVATGVMLALARAAGETAPLLFTAGTATMLTRNLNNPFPSLTVSVYQLAQDPSPQRQQLAWAGILVLITLIFGVNLAIRLVAARTTRGVRKSS